MQFHTESTKGKITATLRFYTQLNYCSITNIKIKTRYLQTYLEFNTQQPLLQELQKMCF